MAFDKSAIIRSVLLAIGKRELAEARRRIPSRTLSAAVELIVEESRLRSRLFIPHYWAVYVHDGHRAIHPTTASKLVFFDNPKDDPRRKGARKPERFSQERRLTKQEYQLGLQINKERADRGQRPFMFVVSMTKPQIGKPFFDRMATKSSQRVGKAALKAFDKEMQNLIDTDPSLRPEKKSARFSM